MDQTQRFLHDVSDKLGSIKTLRTDFVQQRRMTAFMDTLTAEGTCYYQAPDKIRWELKRPYPSALVFNKGKVAKFLYDNDRPRKLNPGAKEIMREVLKLISLWMRGDFESSGEFFDMQVSRRPGLLLRLSLKRPNPRDSVSLIEVSLCGSGTSRHMCRIMVHTPDSVTILSEHELQPLLQGSSDSTSTAPPVAAVLNELRSFVPMWTRGVFDFPKDSFEMEVVDAAAYILSLTPRARQMAEIIKSISLTLDADSKHIKNVTITEQRGDQIVITFHHTMPSVDLGVDLFALE